MLCRYLDEPRTFQLHEIPTRLQKSEKLSFDSRGSISNSKILQLFGSRTVPPSSVQAPAFLPPCCGPTSVCQHITARPAYSGPSGRFDDYFQPLNSPIHAQNRHAGRLVRSVRPSKDTPGTVQGPQHVGSNRNHTALFTKNLENAATRPARCNNMDMDSKFPSE